MSMVQRCAVPNHIISIAEIAERLGGISRQRADQLTRHGGFPAPIARTRSGRVWDRHEVAAWAVANGREWVEPPV